MDDDFLFPLYSFRVFVCLNLKKKKGLNDVVKLTFKEKKRKFITAGFLKFDVCIIRFLVVGYCSVWTVIIIYFGSYNNKTLVVFWVRSLNGESKCPGRLGSWGKCDRRP